MQMNPYESGADRVVRTDPELLARVQAIETILPTLATRAQLEQLRGELKEGLGEVRTEMHAALGAVRTEMHEALGAVRTEMHEALGAVRAEMHETVGVVRSEMQAVRTEMKACIGELHVEMHRTVTNAMKWSIGIAISCVGLAATLMTAVMPLIGQHLRGG
ncbi:hypothetical protein [Roseateles sp. MS654]|uniref:hypothetical protein n=1 Tax=Roseateles sp. MS654 TaxID=3412685 RepID=UPI003C2FD49F